MSTIFNLIKALGLDTVLRARVLQELRVLGAYAAGFISNWLVAHGVSPNDATAVGASIASLVLTCGSAGFSWIDPAKVNEKITAAHAQGVATAAAAITAGTVTPAAITAVSGTPDALLQLAAKLKAGHG